jgi:hypothetical protein
MKKAVFWDVAPCRSDVNLTRLTFNPSHAKLLVTFEKIICLYVPQSE